MRKCGGLPLGITVIGGLLGKSPKTQEYWEKIAKDKSLILNLGENNPLGILYLSYKYLPIYLKPCFLNFGMHSEDYNIDVSDVIKLWVAEGFIKANKGENLEEVAESYLNDLVDRNLLLLDFSIPSSKSCSTHDLVRDLCIKLGEKENFFCVQRSIDGNRHFIADKIMTRFYAQECHASKTPSIPYPLIVPAKRAAPFKTRLLRVFYCNNPRPYYPLQEVNMHFLRDNSYYIHDCFLPSLVSRFWRLQTIIVRTSKEFVAPAAIWKMPQLRHIDILLIRLPPPSDDDVYVLRNLQTLSRIENLIFSEEVCKRLPNIKQLSIYVNFSLQRGACRPCYHLENLGCFDKLESLQYDCYISEYCSVDSFQNIKFPSSLKMLKLWNCKLKWSYMAVIASLPHLQFLYLQENAVAATEWVFVDERFVSLKCLHISCCDHVTKWVAQSSNFPALEELYIWYLHKLDEIPSGIGEIPTLQSIHLFECSESVNISTVEILQEQENFGNLGLQLIIELLSWSNKAALLWKKIKK